MPSDGGFAIDSPGGVRIIDNQDTVTNRQLPRFNAVAEEDRRVSMKFPFWLRAAATWQRSAAAGGLDHKHVAFCHAITVNIIAYRLAEESRRLSLKCSNGERFDRGLPAIQGKNRAVDHIGSIAWSLRYSRESDAATGCKDAQPSRSPAQVRKKLVLWTDIRPLPKATWSFDRNRSGLIQPDCLDTGPWDHRHRHRRPVFDRHGRHGLHGEDLRDAFGQASL